MRRLAAVVIAVVVLAVPGRADADGPIFGGGNGTCSGGGAANPSCGVTAPGSPSSTPVSDGGSGIVHCQYSDANPTVGTGSTEVFNPVPGQQYFLVCTDGSGQVVFADFVVFNPAAPAPIDGATLARQARKTLPLFFPGVQTSPPYDREQLVHLRTWLWVGADSWQSRSATASVPGLAVTVTASPERIDWSMGDGATETCSGPGVAYDASKPDGAQSTYCSHTFDRASAGEPDGVYRARATMWWQVTWTATDGSSGALPEVFRFTDFTLRVGELQALREGSGT
jgi:hypothetical protein